MREGVLTALMALASLLGTAQTATNFSCNDCKGDPYDLFSKLDSGKVVVICWVMPCLTCVGGSLTTYNVVQSYESTHPGTVKMFLCDDFGNTSCPSLNGWAAANNLINTVRFSNTAINMADYGSYGMPKVVVLGGTAHTVFFDANDVIDPTGLQNAINAALVVAGVEEHANGATALSVFPNPAGPSATVKFTLPAAAGITMELFNLAGKRLETAYNGKLPAGGHEVPIHLAGLAAGTYLLKLSDGTTARYTNLIKEK